MTYADTYNIRTTSVKFNDVADALDGLLTRNYIASTGGLANAYTATPAPAWGEYVPSSFIIIVPHVTNTAGSPSVTLNVSGLGDKAIKRGGADIAAGALIQGIPTILAYTGVHFEILIIQSGVPLFIDTVNNRIGINNTTPSYPLDVTGDINSTGNVWGLAGRFTTAYGTTVIVGNGAGASNLAFRNYNVAANAWQLGVRSDVGGANQDLKLLRYTTSGTVYAGIPLQVQNSTGYIGIGGIEPSFPLDVLALSGNAVGINIRGRASDNIGVLLFTNNAISETGRLQVTSTIFGMSVPGAGAFTFSTSSAERVRIDGTGLGIGINAPSYPLDIQSNSAAVALTARARASDNIGSIRFSTSTDTEQGRIQWDTDYLRIEKEGDNPILFYTNNSEKMRLKGDGFLGLGTTNPTYRLQLSTDSAAKPSTNTWTIASDSRIKTNIQPYTKGLAEIVQVAPITYDYNGKGRMTAGPGGISIIAQDLQPIFPECVGSYKGKLEETDEEEIDILNYNGHAITFALINAIKELDAKVKALEALQE